QQVGRRTGCDDTYTSIETTGGNQVIGQVDAISAPELGYPEAVYIHAGQTHFVERLDTTNKVAYVRREDMDYYTQAILESSIQVKGTDREKRLGDSGMASPRPSGTPLHQQRMERGLSQESDQASDTGPSPPAV